MEFILVIAVIAVLCIIFRINTDIIIMCSLIFVWLVFAVMSLIFIYFTIRLILSEKTDARFSGFEKYGKSRFRRACYATDDDIYPCVFPEEGILRDKLYRKDKIYRIRLDRRKKRLYDRFATATCIVGTITSVSVTVIAVIVYMTV